MVTKTMYADKTQVIIDIGAAAPVTAEWLAETTYLLDAMGHTTAMYAQTDKPTYGVSLQPVPYTAIQAIVSNAASSLPTRTPTSSATGAATPTSSTTASTPRRPPKTVTIALAAAGGIIGVILMAMTFYLFRRRRNTRRIYAKGNLLASAEDAAVDSSSLDSIEKLKNGPGRSGAGTLSWEAFLKEVEKEYGMSFSDGSESSMNQLRKYAAELEERYNKLQQTKAIWPIKSGSRSSDTKTTSPAGESPPITRNSSLVHLKHTTSILKRPSRKGLVEAVQSMLGTSSSGETEAAGATYRPNLIQKQEVGVKKGVRFGNNEIREFGATPAPSRTSSMVYD